LFFNSIADRKIRPVTDISAETFGRRCTDEKFPKDYEVRYFFLLYPKQNNICGHVFSCSRSFPEDNRTHTYHCGADGVLNDDLSDMHPSIGENWMLFLGHYEQETFLGYLAFVTASTVLMS
jgi:hypothetical protein